MVVDVLVGLHPEELRGEELAVVAVPGRETGRGGRRERTPGVLVHADGDPDVALAGRMESAASWMALAAVAHTLKTLVNGMPVRPTRRVSGSGLVTSSCRRRELDVAPLDTGVLSAALMASAPISITVLSPTARTGAGRPR